VPHHIHQQRTMVAVLGSSTLGEHTLAMLLEDEGYAARLLKAPPPAATTTVLLPEAEGGSVEGLLEGVDVVLLWPAPTLRDDAREAFVGAMRSAATAKIPLVGLSPSMVVASNDELAGEGPFMRHFEQLMGVIRKVLGSPAGSVSFLELGGVAV
jgi:hypothetical protein